MVVQPVGPTVVPQIVTPQLPLPKLPAVEIPKFSGDYKSWNAFWDIYSALIHDRVDIPDVVKFTSLRSYLTGRAFKTIEGLTVTGDNYYVAVKLLKGQFQQIDQLLTHLIRELKELPVPRHSHVIC